MYGGRWWLRGEVKRKAKAAIIEAEADRIHVRIFGRVVFWLSPPN